MLRNAFQNSATSDNLNHCFPVITTPAGEEGEKNRKTDINVDVVSLYLKLKVISSLEKFRKHTRYTHQVELNSLRAKNAVRLISVTPTSSSMYVGMYTVGSQKHV